jgi:hypothetical protein
LYVRRSPACAAISRASLNGVHVALATVQAALDCTLPPLEVSSFNTRQTLFAAASLLRTLPLARYTVPVTVLETGAAAVVRTYEVPDPVQATRAA